MGIEISTALSRLDMDMIHGFLATSYWAAGVPREVLVRAFQGSLCFGAYEDGRQVGFARVITDRATYAYLADVFIVEARRGRGYSKLLMQAVKDHPELQNLRRWSLATRDAHGLYMQFGFRPLGQPDRQMEILDSDVYRRMES